MRTEAKKPLTAKDAKQDAKCVKGNLCDLCVSLRVNALDFLSGSRVSQRVDKLLDLMPLALNFFVCCLR